MALLTGGETLVRALAAHGVEAVFGIPGTHNLPVYAHLRRHGIRHVLPRHEQGAGYAADGYARATGRPGVCLTTTGPGLLNAMTAAAQAYSDSVPVLLVSPGMPLRHPGRGNGQLHEVKDQQAAVAAVVAASHRVTSVAEIPRAVAVAFAAMRNGRPRPVHIEVPFDLLEEAEETEIVAPLPTSRPVPDPAGLGLAAGRLAAAAAPGIIAGGGARGAAAELRRLAERLGAPVVTTANGKGTLPEDHPLALGAGLHHPAVSDFVGECDAVLAVGTELAPADLWYGPLPLAGRLIRVDVDPDQLVANALPAVAVAGDAAAALAGILDRLPAPPQHAGADTAPEAAGAPARAARWRERVRAQARAEGAPWLPVVAALAGALGRDGILCGDSAMACYYGALSNLPRYAPGSFLYPAGFGTLGYGLPAAIGAKVGRPGVRVAALVGDGGLMFSVAELASAAQLGVALPVVVVDNGGYGEIRREMADRGDDVHAVDLGTPDLVGLALALGCRGVEAADPDTLAAALAETFDADRPTLIRVPEQEPVTPG
jgi:thiamine pyrophosphate-dependent acetolactate synthase large subunit-like protein